MVNVDSVPEEMRCRRQWVCWKLVPAHPKPRKVPIDPHTGRAGSSTDPETWGSIEEAVARFRSGGLAGIGYVFTADDGLTGIDLDDSRGEGGSLLPRAREIVDLLDSYAEWSPSGSGVHVIVKGKLPEERRKKRGWVEVYGTGRYFTFTGDTLDGFDRINDREAQARQVVERYLERLHSVWKLRVPPELRDDDESLLRIASTAANADKFNSLWSGAIPPGQSHSEADLALCNLLAFYAGAGGEARVDRLFRNSGLMRSKWDAPRGTSTYGQWTIRKAFEGRTEYFRWPETNGHHPGYGGGGSNGQQKARRTPEIMMAADLMAADFPAPNWVIPGLLCEGLGLLAGKPKLGKSWLALSLGLAVAAGGKALGVYDTRQGAVLYLSLEDRWRRLQSRMRKQLPGLAVAASNRLQIATEWPRADQGGLEMVDSWLRSVAEPRLVMIDVYARFKGQTNPKGNLYEQDYAAAGLIQSLAQAHNVAILLIHHTKKAVAEDVVDEISGTLGPAGAADTLFVLHRKRKEHDGGLFVTGRDVDECELALEFDQEHCLWASTGDADDAHENRTRMAVLAYMARHGGRPAKASEIHAWAIASGAKWSEADTMSAELRRGDGELYSKTAYGKYALRPEKMPEAQQALAEWVSKHPRSPEPDSDTEAF